MVNRIENNINQSTNYVEKAKDNTEKAVTYQQKARKVSIHQFMTGQKIRESLPKCTFFFVPMQKKIWIAICLAILVLIIVIAVATMFGT